VTTEAMKRELIANGRTAEVFAWGDGAVLKLFRPGMPEGIAGFEARVAAVVEAAGLPAPRLLDQVTVDGRAGLVYERLTGRSMLDEIGRRPTSVGSQARSLARLHVRANAVAGAGLPDHKERLRDAIGAASLPEDVADRAIERLEALPSGSAVLHGDLHPGNVVLATGGPEIIDWMTVTCGDPAADVARSIFLVRDCYVPNVSRFGRAALGVIRPWFARAYLAEYRRRTGIDPTAIAAWRPVVLAARLAEGIGPERAGILRELRRTLAR
jgi:aminoglycoside phosphotransferase (APT) family kinase protein